MPTKYLISREITQPTPSKKCLPSANPWQGYGEVAIKQKPTRTNIAVNNIVQKGGWGLGGETQVQRLVAKSYRPVGIKLT